MTDTENLGGLVPVSPLDQTLDDMLVTLPTYLDVSSHFNDSLHKSCVFFSFLFCFFLFFFLMNGNSNVIFL